ncbi:LOW QUALITY PROTEIN: RRM_1 domain-containing protein, partial [Cephalotus follicularis]
DDKKHQEEKEEVQELTESSVGYSEVGRLYVGNLSSSMTSSQFAGVFGEVGRVVNVEIVYDRVTDRSRGFGFVRMWSVEEAKAILLFDGSQVGGRTVKVNFSEVPRGGEREVMGPRIGSSYQGFVDSPHKIYAGNLGWGLTSQGLRDAFADSGLLSARIIYDRNSGKSRGFSFITFETAENVEYALNAMNGVEVEGRPLRLNLASERPLIAPPLVSNSENNFDGSELLSSI